MSLDDLEKRIQAAEATVATQGDTVRSLKAALKDKSIEKVRAHDIRDLPLPSPVELPAAEQYARKAYLPMPSCCGMCCRARSMPRS